MRHIYWWWDKVGQRSCDGRLGTGVWCMVGPPTDEVGREANQVWVCSNKESNATYIYIYRWEDNIAGMVGCGLVYGREEEGWEAPQQPRVPAPAAAAVH